LGVKAVIAKSFARIHLQNLSNFGILPLIFANPDDWNRIAQGDTLSIPDVRNTIRQGHSVKVINLTQNETYDTEHQMTHYQVDMVLAGSLINLVKQKGT
jgi:aconitate hydratase